ncbi:XRE family transcriptional regulator [Bacillus mycoides]|nr:XRE family transcriptional regulator [Bacillus mycoides]
MSGGGHMKRTWLADLRGKKRMSQAALADKVGVTPGHIADLETGRRDPGGKLALQIAIVLGFHMEHFYLPAYLQNASKREIKQSFELGFPPEEQFFEEYPHYKDKTVGS